MASDYIKALREVQAVGPYHLGGWSLGGVVAFEMARQLLAQREHISLLALIDSAAPGVASHLKGEDELALLVRFSLNLGLSWEQLNDAPEHLLRQGREEQLHWILDQARAARIVPPRTDLPTLHKFLRVYEANVAAMYAYVPQTIEARVTLLRAQERIARDDGDWTMGWDKLTTKGVTVQVIPGNHFTMMREPQLDVLAGRLNECMARASAAQAEA
jgi:thioesterase domain-containing protein